MYVRYVMLCGYAVLCKNVCMFGMYKSMYVTYDMLCKRACMVCVYVRFDMLRMYDMCMCAL